MNTAVENKGSPKPDVMSYQDALLPKKKPGFTAYSIWLVSLSLVLFQFFIQLSAGEIINGFMKSFSLTAFGASILTSAYYYVYVPLQTPAGILMDRFGPRKICTAGAAVLTIGCFIVAGAHDVFLVFLGRILMGFGAAFAFVGSLFIVDKWFPRSQFSIFVGITEASAMLVLVFCGALLASLVEHFGWRACMYGAGTIVGVICVLYGWIVRDRPLNRRFQDKGPKPKRRIIPGLRVLMRMRVAWVNGIYSGVMFSVISVFATLWGIPFLELARHISLTHATFLNSMVCLGTATGSVLLGWLDKHIPVRRYLMMAAAVISTLIMLTVIIWPTMPVVLLVILLILMGNTAACYMLNYTIANEIAALRIRSASIGFVNTLSVGGAPILQPLVGLCLFLLAHHDHPTQTSAYTITEYKIALCVIPLMTAIATWLAYFLPSRRDL